MVDIEYRQLMKKRQLLAVKKVLDDMNVMFWLHSGVLLGYYREHDLIKHDADLDIGVLRSEIPENFAYKLADWIEGSNMRVGWKTNTCLKLYMEEKGEVVSHLDIFIHDGNLKDGLKIKLDATNTSATYEYNIHGFSKVKFLGTDFLVPSNPKEIIFMQYGPNWKTPTKKFQWDKDPCNIVGKPKLVLDDTPTESVLQDTPYGDFTCVFGPLTVEDAATLSKNCKSAMVFSEQPDMSINNVKFVRCDETHGAEPPLKYNQHKKMDQAVIPHPEMYNEGNMRNMLETVWKYMKDGGTLTFVGKPPECVKEFMFDKKQDGTFVKYEMHENWEKNVTAVITTFEAEGLAQKCVNSIKVNHPDMKIVVVNNSKHEIKINGARLIELPFDSGLSRCRNAGIDSVYTPFVYLTDDDQHLVDKTSLKKMYDSVIENKLDIVGGMVINTAVKKASPYHGIIKRNMTTGTLMHGKYKEFKDGTQLMDVTMNFFIARTDVLRKVRWNDRLKVMEHFDFFMRVKEQGFKVGQVPTAKCAHIKKRPGRGEIYSDYRNRSNYYRQMQIRLGCMNTLIQHGMVANAGVCPRKKVSETNKPKPSTPLRVKFVPSKLKAKFRGRK